MPIQLAAAALRLIFWGGILCILDFSISETTSINGRHPTGYRFDILNDFVGMILITVGVSRLSAFAFNQSYLSSMKFVQACAWLNCCKAFMDHFIFEHPALLSFALGVLGVASVCATVVFSNSMLKLCSVHGLYRSSESWRTTRTLTLVIWAIPLSLLHLTGLLSLLTGESFHWNIGGFIFPVLLVFLVPLIHLFMSTSRMTAETGAIPRSFEFPE